MLADPTPTPPRRRAAADPSRLWRALGLPSQRAAAPQPVFEPRRCDAFHELVGLLVSPAESVLVLCVDARRQAAASPRGERDDAADAAAGDPARARARAREERRLGLLLEALTVVAGADLEPEAAAPGEAAGAGVRPLLELLDHLERAVPLGLDVHLIVDRRASCRDPAVQAWFRGRRRFHVHFAADHRRWRERALAWLGATARRQRALGAPRSTLALESAIHRFVRRPPADRAFTWARSGDELLTHLARFLVRRGGA